MNLFLCCSCGLFISFESFLCSSRTGFSFLLCAQKKRNKEKAPAALFGLFRKLFPLNKKNSLTLKQLFVLYAPTTSSISRPKSEAGSLMQHCFARCSGCFHSKTFHSRHNIASLVTVDAFLSESLCFRLVTSLRSLQ